MRSPPFAALAAVLLVACAGSPVPPPPPPLAAAAQPAPAPCSTVTPTVTPSPSAAVEPSAPIAGKALPAPPAKPSAPPAAFREALAAAEKAIAAGDMAAADQKIAAAEASAGDDAHLVQLVARARATRYVYADDFDRAAGAFVAVMPALAKHPELPDEFWAHNTMMMIRAAQGDPAAALAENDQATLCGARGTWDPEGRETLTWQKDRWHRAYLTRMLAESRAGSAKQALVQYAQAALDEYRTKGFPDSVAILDAYFAALDNRHDAALAAARKVDAAKNGDIEDLYLVVVGLEAGGDHAGAEAVRRLMRRPQGGVRIARAIMLRWLELDAKPPAARGFTPWNARTTR